MNGAVYVLGGDRVEPDDVSADYRGGGSRYADSREVLRYLHSTNQWERRRSSPDNCRYMLLRVSGNGRILVVGAKTHRFNDRSAAHFCWCYDCAADTWTEHRFGMSVIFETMGGRCVNGNQRRGCCNGQLCWSATLFCVLTPLESLLPFARFSQYHCKSSAVRSFACRLAIPSVRIAARSAASTSS